MRVWFWVLILLVLPACGDDGPVAPTSDPAPVKPGPQTPEPADVTAADPGLVGYVRIHEPGLYRVDPESLAALGVRGPEVLEIRRGDREMPMDADGVFAVRETGTDGSMTDVYELWAREPRELPPGPTSIPRRRVLDADRQFGDVAAARIEVYAADVPTWFLTKIERGQGTSIPLGPLGAAPDTQQTLTVELAATHVGPVELEAEWGGNVLGRRTTQLDPTTGRWPPLVFTVPADQMPTEEVALVLRDVTTTLPPPARNDVTNFRGRLFVDSIRLDGPLADPTEQTSPFTTVQAKAIPDTTEAIDDALDAEHVIIATPPLLEEAERLAAHRSASGTPSIVVPVLDIYWKYGRGEMTVAAIQRAIQRWETFGRLRYVLLAGDATFDRTDFLEAVTIPTPMARTMYNGATPADRLYVRPADGPATGGPSIGRLPFRDTAAMKAYVDQVIAYETRPPVDRTRRLLRFVTSEGRFGPVADRMIENLFKRVIAESVPAVYDVEITNASASSPFLWPPHDLNAKVVSSLNEGALFYTYVGHGFDRGFDTLRVGPERFKILHIDDVPKIAATGTPPNLFVIACTTAIFDLPARMGVGEALIARPDGPVAYWGATRVCHPGANSLVGVELARRMARGDGRIGDIIRDAWDRVLEPPAGQDPVRNAIVLGVRLAAGEVDLERLALEGRWMYVLLGDPALRVAFPREDIQVRASHPTAEEGQRVDVDVEIETEFADGTEVHLSLELPRSKRAHQPERVDDVRDPKNAAVLRRNHERMNDWAIARTIVTTRDGRATFVFENQRVDAPLVVKAFAVTDDVHQGATEVNAR